MTVTTTSIELVAYRSLVFALTGEESITWRLHTESASASVTRVYIPGQALRSLCAVHRRPSRLRHRRFSPGSLPTSFAESRMIPQAFLSPHPHHGSYARYMLSSLE